MARSAARIVIRLYILLVKLYPLSFQDRFGQEMRSVFAAALDETAERGIVALLGLCWRELLCVPLSLLRVYWSKWQEKIGATRHKAIPVFGLPPPLADGRTSWMQVGLEISLPLSLGVALVMRTYLSLPQPSMDSRFVPGSSSAILFLLPGTLFLIGLARGLPRWAYPAGGMTIGSCLLTAIRFRQLPLLIAVTLAFVVLAGAAAAIHIWIRPLPTWLRRLGQSTEADWTRLSFGVYGAMPLVIATAFDDAYLNDRTACLALAALSMVAGALLYARSRRAAMQMVALVGGTFLCCLCALLDHVYFVGVRGAWIAESGWLIQLWAIVSVLTAAPLLRILFRRMT